MKKLIKGFKGLGKIPCEILVSDEWYVPKGSDLICKACNKEHLENGIWVLEIQDKDYYKSNKSITTLDKLDKELYKYKILIVNEIQKRNRVLQNLNKGN